MIRLLSIILLLFSALNLSAETGMEESFYSSGKIYVVVAVLITIFLGLIAFLLHLERKISRLEKETSNKTNYN